MIGDWRFISNLQSRVFNRDSNKMNMRIILLIILGLMMGWLSTRYRDDRILLWAAGISTVGLLGFDHVAGQGQHPGHVGGQLAIVPYLRLGQGVEPAGDSGDVAGMEQWFGGGADEVMCDVIAKLEGY